jgi:4-hydroxybutyrate CoA-transferase
MNWRDEYARNTLSVTEAVDCIQSNMRAYIHSGCAEPEALVEALMQRAPFVNIVEIIHFMTAGRADYTAPEMEGHFRQNSLFMGGNVRKAVNEGRADFTPIFLSEAEGLFENGQLPIDVALIQMSPPDAHGFCSLGVDVHYVVTEFGVAYLHGRTIRQRAEALIQIADPRFRDELYVYCEKRRWLQRPVLQER